MTYFDITMTTRERERATRLSPKDIRTIDWFTYFDNYWGAALDSLKKSIESNNRNRAKEKRQEFDND